MSNELHQEFEQLRRQFIAALPERAKKLEHVWNHLHHLNWSDQGIRALQQFLQKLGSSSANYGFMAISNSAQYLALYLQELLDLSRLPASNERHHIDQKITLLKQHMRHAGSAPPPAEMLPLSPPANTALLNGQLIYVIDPDRGHASMVSNYLRRCGFTTATFDSVATSMERLHEVMPHAILMDADLHPDGVLAGLRSIKAMFVEPVPVLLMSARSDVSARLRALRAGSDDYLIKPLNFSLLLEKLIQTLRNPNRIYRVMIVDDDPEIAEFEAEVLRYAGMEVLCVHRPLLSLEKASSFKPDLVILDMHMPEMNGLELATLLRQDPEFVLLPIIFVTADTDVNLHQQIKALGVNASLIKPVDPDQLIALCEQTLLSTNALKNRVARITQRSQQPHKITPAYFFAAVDDEIFSRKLGQERSALYYISIKGFSEVTQQLDRIEISAVHEQLCTYLGDILGADEHWVDLAPLVICVLSSRRSALYHQQRSDQLKKHLNRYTYQRRNPRSRQEPLALEFGLEIVALEEELGSAHHALTVAEEAFEREMNPKPAQQPTGTATKPTSDAAPPTEDYTRFEISKDLVLAFQPIISIEEQKIDHFSVLTRLRRDDGELVSAGQFMSRIDQPGRRLELDRWVLQKAVAAITENATTRENATLFLHLARDSLGQKSFFSFAANVLHSSRLRGTERLVFMLEEPWVAANLEQARQITKALLDIHCGICLTQAGATPQTEQLVSELPLHYLRLSPEVTARSEQALRLKSLIAAAHARGSQVIATRIEDSRNLSSLWMEGVRLFEGFFIQPPDSAFHLQNDIVFTKEFIQHSEFNR